MYLNQNAKKQSEKCFTYDLTRGIEGSGSSRQGRIISAMNVSQNEDARISPMDVFYRKSCPNDAISVGSYLGGVYYNSGDGFYFNGERKGDLSVGEKVYVNFSGRVYIFPDRSYYDINEDKFDCFYRSITGKIRIEVNNYQYAASYMYPDSGNLAEVFCESHSIKVNAANNIDYNGCYQINKVDKEKGKVYFGLLEGEIGGTIVDDVSLSNDVPALRGACVCKNRIFGYIGNKIYASVLGDPMSWCVKLDGGAGSYVYENTGGEDFTACTSSEDQPIFFTPDNIYKLYGSNVGEYSLRLISGFGGISDGLFGAHAKVLGDIYFVCGNSIVKFTGSRSDIVCRLSGGLITSFLCSPYYTKLYFCYRSDSGEHLCALDVLRGTIYEINIAGVKGLFNLCGNICAMTGTEIIALEGKREALPEGFVADGEILSSIEFYEIHNDWDRFSPSKLYLRGKIMRGGEVEIYCMLANCGEWSPVYKITEEGERLWEFSLPASLTDSFRLKIEGSGAYCLNNIYVLFS